MFDKELTFDAKAVTHALELVSDSATIVEELNKATMRRLEYQAMPSPEQLENDERWWNTYTQVMNEFLGEVVKLNTLASA